MNHSPIERDARPLARLHLAKVAVPRERAPVFHVFEELYARAAGCQDKRSGREGGSEE